MSHTTDANDSSSLSSYARKKARQAEIAARQERGEEQVWNSASGVVRVPTLKKTHTQPHPGTKHPSGLHTKPAAKFSDRLHYSGAYDTEPHVTKQFAQTVRHACNAEVKNAAKDFIDACLHDADNAPIFLASANQHESVGASNSFAIAMRKALASHATKAHLSEMKAPLDTLFPQMLYDRVLIAAYDNKSEKNYKLLQSVPGNPGFFELKPQVSDAVVTFARACIEKHGALLTSAIDRSPAR